MVSALSILVTSLLVVSFVGFAYVKIVAPTIRRRLQFRIFRIRDNCRQAVIANRISFDEFEYLQDRCNFAISLIEVVDFRLMFRIFFLIRGLSSLERQKMDATAEPFKNSATVRESTKEIASVTKTAVVVNSGLWGLLFCLVVFLSRWIGTLKRSKLFKLNSSEVTVVIEKFPYKKWEQIKRFPMRPAQV